MSGAHRLKSVVGTVNRISRWFNYLGVGVLTIMMLLTVSDVLLRYLFNSPILGTLELTEYMMVPVVFLGLAWCAVRRENIKVDILVSRLKTRPRAFLDSITCFLSLTVMVFITWQSFMETGNIWESYRVSDILHVPAYPFFVVLTLGCFLLCIVLVINLIENIVQGVSRQ
jgi:TRAP-type C4-dicarboxylate transport system permease small subunit